MGSAQVENGMLRGQIHTNLPPVSICARSPLFPMYSNIQIVLKRKFYRVTMYTVKIQKYNR